MLFGLLWGSAFAEEPVVVMPPITEIDHPTYRDAAGTVVDWSDLRRLSDREAIGQVRRRRAGRTVLRGMFLAATALEAWGTTELIKRDNWAALPLGAQTVGTGLCGVLMFTGAPGWWQEDRAIVLGGLPVHSAPPLTPVLAPSPSVVP